MTVTQDQTSTRRDDPHFARRHIGITDDAQQVMLARLGFDSLDALIEAVVPKGVRSEVRPGTRRTRRISPRSARADSRLCSTSRR